MKHFYLFYVEFNNMENIDLAVDVDDLRRIDEQLSQILADAKVELPREEIDSLTDQIYSQLF